MFVDDSKSNSNTSKEASYITKKHRRKSLYQSPNGEQYSPGDILGRGASAEVRKLVPYHKDSPPLVVKSMQKNIFGSNGKSEAQFLQQVYPEKLAQIHHFPTTQNDRVFRLVMPNFGNKSLESILLQEGISLNHRYTIYLKAIRELKRIHQLGTAHGDTHSQNVLVDDNEACFFIDGHFNALNKQNKLTDIRFFITMSIQFMIHRFNWLSPGRECGEETIGPAHIYYRLNAKKDGYVYHLIDVHGTLVKNTLSIAELRHELTAAENESLTKKLGSHYYSIDDEYTPYLRGFLEITSKRGETRRHHSCYFSKHLLENLSHIESLDQLEQLIAGEIEYNSKLQFGIMTDIKDKLLSIVDIACKHEKCPQKMQQALRFLQAEIENIDVANVANTVKAQDDVMQKLMHLLYQAERITSFKPWTIRFFNKAISEVFNAVAGLFSDTRECLRQHSTLLPEIPVPLSQILYSRSPVACDTVNQYVIKHGQGKI